MKSFLDVIKSEITAGQKTVLGKFLQDLSTTATAGNYQEVSALLQSLGVLIDLPKDDLTKPEVYNTAVQTLAANIAGLYKDIDKVDAFLSALSDLNTSELQKLEIALRQVSSILEATKLSAASDLQYNDIFFETFAGDQHRETSIDWYKPIPVQEQTGLVESYSPLVPDSKDKALKLSYGGSFNRSNNILGEPLSHLNIDEVLGISIDKTHPPSKAVDGDIGSYWRELVVADLPIEGDVNQSYWLPPSYTAGAACRLHFRWPCAVPFTEIVLSPFSRFPVQCLQVAWDNRGRNSINYINNGFFASGGLNWTSSGSTITYSPSGGYHNIPYALNSSTSLGRTVLQARTFTVSGTQIATHLHFKIKQTPDTTIYTIMEWANTSGSILRTDTIVPMGRYNEWYEWSTLLLAPSGSVTGGQGRLYFVMDGSGSVYISDVVVSPVAGKLNYREQPDLQEDSIVLPVDNAAATDLWLVLGQPHYELIQTTNNDKDSANEDVWDYLTAQINSKSDVLYNINYEAVKNEEVDYSQDISTSSKDGLLNKEVFRLTSRVQDLLNRLLIFTTVDQTAKPITKYVYTMGAWDIEVRHREYASQGLWVSKPYLPRGECRNLLLTTNPPIEELGDKIKFWLTPRAEDGSEKAKRFTGRVTFHPSTETLVASGDTAFVLSPIRVQKEFDGTDRHRAVALDNYPYINRESIWNIQNRISSGTLTTAQTYDPNKLSYLVQGTNLIKVDGYRPIKVSLYFEDGTFALPDSLGPTLKGSIAYSGIDILEDAAIEEDDTTENDNRDKDNREKKHNKKKWPRFGRVFNRASSKSTRGAKNPKSKLSKPLSILFKGNKRVRTRKKTRTVTALQTKYNNIVKGPNGVALSLYWHKSNDDFNSNKPNTSGDVLISPTKYTVDVEKGIISLRDKPPNGDMRYDSYIAYYYYYVNEETSREDIDYRSTATKPTSGLDFDGYFTQNYPVTRNVTDFIYGEARELRPSQLDDLLPDYYPVFEYMLDSRGRLIFADDLFRFGDIAARIVVEYESLKIAPRLLIEYPKRGTKAFTTKTPILEDFTLMLNSRR